MADAVCRGQAISVIRQFATKRRLGSRHADRAIKPLISVKQDAPTREVSVRQRPNVRPHARYRPHDQYPSQFCSRMVIDATLPVAVPARR